MDTNPASLIFQPHEPGATLRVQVPGGVVCIEAGVLDNDGRPMTQVVVHPANDENGGDKNGDVWDLTDGAARTVITRRGTLMTNPEGFGELIRDRLADLGLRGVLDLTNGEAVRLGQVVTKQTDALSGDVTFLGGDRVLVGRPKYTTDEIYYYVYSPRARRECLVLQRDVHIEARAPRWAFWTDPVQDDRITGGYVPSVVVEHVPGHWPLNGASGGRAWVWGLTLKEAKAVCEEENLRRRITPEAVTEIVRTSITASTTATSDPA